MNTNFYRLCSQSLSVRGIFEKDGILQIFPFNQAPENITGLYATYQTIAGQPTYVMAGRTQADYVTIQVDVWGDTSNGVSDGYEAIRYAIELDCTLSFNMTDREQETGKYRYSFDCNFITKRHFSGL